MARCKQSKEDTKLKTKNIYFIKLFRFVLSHFEYEAPAKLA